MSPIIIAIIVSIVLLASGWLLLNKQNERHAQRLYENEIAKAKEARQEYLDQAKITRDEYMAKAREDAEMLKRDKLLEIKEEFLKKKASLADEVQARQATLQSIESKLKKREEQLAKLQDDISRRSQAI